LNILVLDSSTSSDYFRGAPAVVPQLHALRPAELGVPAIVKNPCFNLLLNWTAFHITALGVEV
jgi:hypothetical protein